MKGKPIYVRTQVQRAFLWAFYQQKKKKEEILMKNIFQSSRIAVELEQILFTKKIFLVNFFLLGTCNTSISMSTL